ncbi:TonB-dependent receptor, partial [Roseateles sp. GG27B]
SQGDRANGWNVTGMAYQAKWNATDQIPQRAVEAGQLGRFDPIDPTDGGASHRYSLSGAWRSSTATSTTEVNAYVAH